jgi:hypothetical protein
LRIQDALLAALAALAPSAVLAQDAEAGKKLFS